MRAQVLGMIVVLGAYYGGVIMQLDARVAAVEQSGTAVREQKLEELKNQTGAVKSLKKKLEQREKEMAEKYGQLRYLPESEMTPLDTLMEGIIRAAKQAGGDIRQVTPIEAVDTGLMSLQGLECSVLLPREAAFEVFLNSMRDQYCPLTNEHSITLSRTRTGIQLEARFTVLRLKKAPGNNKALSAAGKALETWQAIQRPRGKVQYDALLEARPKPVPTVPPAPTTKPVTVASVKAPPPPARPVVAIASPPPPPPLPPPPKFSGKLIGLTNIGGKGVALVDMGGSQKVIEEGQEVDGWKLDSIRADRMILKSGGQTSTVYFVGEEEFEERPAAAAASGAAQPRRGGLGLRGKFAPASAVRLPAPFDGLRRVFEVTGVDDQTPAGRAGLRANDRILAIDQVPLHSTDQMLGLRARIESGQTATLSVERGGSLIPVNFTKSSQ